MASTFSPRTSIKFSIKKILYENEAQRRERVKKKVELKKEEMDKAQKELQLQVSQILLQSTTEREREIAEKLANLEAKEEQVENQLEIDRKNEVQRQRFEESEEILQEIVPFREILHAKWTDIANILRNCQDKNSASLMLTQYHSKLKELSVQMETINEKAKIGALTIADVKMAEIVAQYSNEIFLSFKDDVDEIDALCGKELAERERNLAEANLPVQHEAQRIEEPQDVENKEIIDTVQMQNNVDPGATAYLDTKQNTFVQQNTNIQSTFAQPNSNTQNAFVQQNTNIQNTFVQQNSNIQNAFVQQNTNIQNAFVQQPSEVDNGSLNENAVKISENVVASPVNTVPSEPKTIEVSDYSAKVFSDSHQFLRTYNSSFQEFSHSNAMKKFKFECQKTLNLAINALSNSSQEQLIEKFDKIKSFLSGRGTPNISANPQALNYSKYLLAQKIIEQGDTSISSKPELAFPFAAMAVALWNDWPDFGDILLAFFRTKCPFFVPYLPVTEPGQSEDDYVKLIGWKRTENGYEKPEQYWKRIGGMMYLYASILVTKQRKSVNKPHPHGLAFAWRWLASALNIEPTCDTADIFATLIFTLLEVTGGDLWKTYPNQFPKILLVMKNVYFQKLNSFDSAVKAPVVRLGEFLDLAIKNARIPPPRGQLPPGFW